MGDLLKDNQKRSVIVKLYKIIAKDGKKTWDNYCNHNWSLGNLNQEDRYTTVKRIGDNQCSAFQRAMRQKIGLQRLKIKGLGHRGA